MLLEQLTATERHIARGREHIAHQRELIAELEHDGHATAAARAKDILQSFKQCEAAVRQRPFLPPRLHR